jgi:hypothetical protein
MRFCRYPRAYSFGARLWSPFGPHYDLHRPSVGMASVDRVEPPSGTPVAWLMRRPVTVQGSNSHLIQFRNNSSGETAMAIFDMSKNTGSGVEMWKCLGLLFTVGAPGAVTYGTIGAQSSTGYDILYGPNGGPVPSKVHFGGTGFTYPTATSSAMTGTVKNLSLSASWDSTTGVQANIAVTGLSMSISNFFLTTGGHECAFGRRRHSNRLRLR